MRVAIDSGPLLDPPTGVGRYTSELIGALENLGVDVRKFAVAFKGEAPDDVARIRLPARVARWTWPRTGRPSVLNLVDGADVIHATNFVLPPLQGAAGVVTVHDLSYLREGAFPGADALKELVPWSLERAHRVLVPTRAIADEVVLEYGVPIDRIAVTHEGVSPVFFGATPLSDSALAGMGIARPFVLATGTDAPRKNLHRLLDAWVMSRSALKGWALVLAGPRGWGPRFVPTDDVHLLGWVGDETLPGLMAAADVFCYPSVYEGFGLPPLEAMATGTACLAGRYSAAQEVLGGAAVIVEPADTDALAKELVRLVQDEQLRKNLGVKGKAQASSYTWERTARATLDAYLDATSQANAGGSTAK